MSRLLDRVKSPADLKVLKAKKLEQLASEIRQELITRVTLNGGHLASNLGVVELTIALHRVFNSPQDKVIWDVGHQSYTHKLLTGRLQQFDTLRQYERYLPTLQLKKQQLQMEILRQLHLLEEKELVVFFLFLILLVIS